MRLIRLTLVFGVLVLLLAASGFDTRTYAEEPTGDATYEAQAIHPGSSPQAGPTPDEDTDYVITEPEIYPGEEDEYAIFDTSLWLPRRDYWPDTASIRTYEDLTREIAAYIEGSNGLIGVALYRPADSFLAGVNLDAMLPLASVAKIEILLAYLSSVQDEGRELAEDEHSMLEAMITYSDNYSADLLWESLGGGPAIQAFLLSHGLTETMLSESNTWGSNHDSPRNLALLLGQLHSGQLLDTANTELALGLLNRVAVEQRWGITTGIEDPFAFTTATEGVPFFDETEAAFAELMPSEDVVEFGPYKPDDADFYPLPPEQLPDSFAPPSHRKATVYLKDGWYPGEEGWRLNSAGIIQPDDGSPAYVLVVLSDGQPGYEYGIETISTVAGLINAFMLNHDLPIALTASASPTVIEEP